MLHRNEPFAVLTHGQRTGGEIAVDAFFILSGYLISQSWLRSAGSLDYLSRRISRIYPGFLVAASLGALVVSPLLEPDVAAYWQHFNWRQFLPGLLNLVVQSPETIPSNGSLWTIRMEFVCYMGVLVLGLAGLLARRAWVLGFLLVGAAILAAQLNLGMPIRVGRVIGWLIGLPTLWPRLGTDFLAGTVFYLYRDRISLTATGFWTALAGLILAGIQPWLQLLPVAIPFLGGYLLLCVGYLGFNWMHDWARRGDLSYGLYLYAFPIQMLLIHWFGPWLNPRFDSFNPLILFLAAVPLTALCAALSWRFVESPAMGMRRPVSNWLRRRVSPVGVTQ